MFEFELSDNADAVVRLVIVIGKLLFSVFIICMLWDRRKPAPKLFANDAHDQPQSHGERESDSAIDYEDFDNTIWLPGPNSTRVKVVFMEDGEFNGSSDLLEDEEKKSVTAGDEILPDCRTKDISQS